jgi:serine/threonine protein kinase
MILPSIPNLRETNEKFENGTASLSKDSFTFITQIGSGAFGKVYKVSSKVTNRLYALKVLSKNQLTHLKLLDQLKNEISIFARCNHENIIRLYGAFEDANYIYMIMELANDSNLFNKLKKSKKFSEKVTYEYLKDIIQALVYLHSQNPVILHRDLKPENILIHDGRCKLSDFGWSNVDAEFRNTFCGTPDYLAPEMILGSGHTEKLDIWTIGILMYELLHGKPPFSPKEKVEDGRMMQKLIEKNILKGEIEFVEGLSPEAQDCIRTLLNPQEALRPHAKEILEHPFFKRFNQKVDPKLLSTGGSTVASTGSLEDVNKDSMTKRLGEYKTRMEILSQANKKLVGQLEMADSAHKMTKKELEFERAKSKKLAEEYALLKSMGTDSDCGSGDVKSLRLLLTQQSELERYLFRRNLHVTRVVDEFFEDFVIHSDNQSRQPTHMDTLMKLESIFREYIRFKNYAEEKKMHNPYEGATKKEGESTLGQDVRKSRMEIRKMSPLLSFLGRDGTGKSEKVESEFLTSLEKYFKI